MTKHFIQLGILLGLCTIATANTPPKFAIMTTEELQTYQSQELQNHDYDEQEWNFVEFETKTAKDGRSYLVSPNVFNRRVLKDQAALIAKVIESASTSPLIDSSQLPPQLQNIVNENFSRETQGKQTGFQDSKFVISPAIEIEFEMNGVKVTKVYDLSHTNSPYVTQATSNLKSLTEVKNPRTMIANGLAIVPIEAYELHDPDLVKLEVEALIE